MAWGIPDAVEVAVVKSEKILILIIQALDSVSLAFWEVLEGSVSIFLKH
jgi:hypothetical protein